MSLHGLSVKNLTKRMVAQGCTPKGMHPESYVRKMLHTCSQLFELREKGHWSLKSHLA